MYSEKTIVALNERLRWAKHVFPKHFPSETPPVQTLDDMYHLPVLEKEQCSVASLDFANAEFCAAMASGGTSGKRTMILNSLQDYLKEGEITAELCSSVLPHGEKKYGFANVLAAGGFWGGGFMLFIASMSHKRFVGLNVGNRTPKEMVHQLYGFMHENGGGLDGILIAGLPSILVAMARIVEEEGKELPVPALVYGGEGLESAQKDYLRRVFQGATIHSIYSGSEGNLMGFSFGEDDQLLSLVHESCFVWLMDCDTHQCILEAGKPGRVVVTNLYGSRKPFNFASNDMAIWEKVGATFRLRGRVQDMISLGNLGALRFRGQDMREKVLEITHATQCQIHIDDQQALRIVVDRMRNDHVLTRQDMLELVFSVAPFANHQLLKAQLRISIAIGEVIATAVGKTPLVIDHREV